MSINNRISPQPLPQVYGPKPSSPHFHPQYQNSAISINKIVNQQLQQPPHQTQPSNPAPTLYTCRICLQQHPALHANTQEQLSHMLSLLQEQKKLAEPKYVITACRCQGTAGYVHQKCMIQWIDAQYKRSKQRQMKCEICLVEILYDRKFIPYFEFSCKNLDDISGCNIACLSSVMLMLALFVVLETQAKNLSFNELTKLTIYILIAIMTLLMGISMAMIIKEAFYKVKKETIKVYSNDEIDIKGILKDDLTHYDRRSSTHRTHTNVRSVRSARSIRSGREGQRGERQRQRNNEVSLQHTERIQSSHRQRSQRNPRSHQQIQNHQQQVPISHRNPRTVRMPPSSRSIQVRSRQHIEDQPRN